MHSSRFLALMGMAALLGSASLSFGAGGSLRAGAAKIDITPQDLTGITNLWRTPFEGVHDKIYLRALYVDDGTNSAAIVASDLVEYGDTMGVRERIAKEIGIPADHVILTASHDHNAPRVGTATPGASAQMGGPGTARYSVFVYDKIMEALKQAKANARPAKVGIGTGKADVNTNRDEYIDGMIRLGVNPDGPSDKTVWVVKFETPEGEPIAILLNYAVHAVVLGPENKLVTGDLPGVAERYIEQYYKDKVVALWTIGAAGDQNPKYMAWDTTFTNKDREPGYPLIEALGQIVGEETVYVAGRIKNMTSTARIAAGEKILTCPTRPRNANQQSNRPQAQGGQTTGQNQQQAATMNVHLNLILINDIAITGVSGEVVTNIYWRLRKASPFTNTMMVTMSNDRIGYIWDDAAYFNPTLGAALERGCAETGIINGLVGMMEQLR